MRSGLCGERVRRHVRVEERPSDPEQHRSTAGGDGRDACGAVAERSGEHERDRGRSEGERHAAEERVDRGTVILLERTAHQANLVGLGKQVEVRRRDVDPSGDKRLVVTRVGRRQRPGAIEDRREAAGRERRYVEHDEHGRREIGRQGSVRAG